MRSRTAALFIVVGLVAGACAGDDDPVEESADATTTTAAEEPTTTEVPDTDEPPATETTETTEVDIPVTVPTEPVCGDLAFTSSSVTEVDCAEPHDLQLASTLEFPGTFAATDRINPGLAALCRETAEDLVGGPVPPTGLLVLPLDAEPVDASVSDDIDCWVASPVDGALTGSLTEVEPADALGDLVSVFQIEVGTCFVTEIDEFSLFTLVRPADCGDRFAELLTGIIPIEDEIYPGAELLEEQARTACLELFDESDFGDDFYFIVPAEAGWVTGQREIVCSNYETAEEGGSDETSDDAADDVDDDAEGVDYAAGTCFVDADVDDDPIGDVVPCDEPHRWEYVVNVDSPVDTVPADIDEARATFTAACAAPVEDAAGLPVSDPGLSLAYQVVGELGEPVVGSIACFAGAPGDDHLVAPLDGDLAAALGDGRILWTLDPGTCFTFLPDTFDLGVEAECDAADARIAIGAFEAPDGPYPGEDELRELRGQRCAELLEETAGVSIEPDSISGTFPPERDWDRLDRRIVTCDGAPA